MSESPTKHCPKCDRMLPLSEFNRDASSRDGLTRRCRGCWAQWYLDNRDEARERGRRYRQANPRQYTPEQQEKYREYARQWRLAHPERKRELTRLWNEANPDKRRESSARHRQRHPLYKTWEQMLNRCENLRHKDYERYGARGIKVCAEWHDYQVFAADIERLIGPRPEGKSLDRKNNDGDYEAGNVRWATPKEQANNRRPRKPRHPRRTG